MSDLITTEEATKLLDEATPGPWEADGDPWNRIIWSSAENRVCFMAHSNGLDDARDIATSNLVAAAPDLARTVIALHAQLADAQAAQTMVVERAADLCKAQASLSKTNEYDLAWCRCAGHLEYEIRALAPIDSLDLVRELRAERDRFETALGRACKVGGTTYLVERAETAEAERDRLAAANAVLEAKVGVHTELAWVVERDKPDSFGPTYFSGYIPTLAAGWSQDHMDAIRFARCHDAERMAERLRDQWPDCRTCEHMWLDAALATQEAGT